MNMSDKPQWLIIGRGKNGWHASAVNCSGSGGSLEPYLWNGEQRPGYAGEAPDGAVVYDASEAPFEAFVDLVCRGPILKCDRSGCERFRDHAALARMLGPGGLEGGFQTIGQHVLRESPKGYQGTGLSSVDYVGWDVYRPLLERLGGVRFGVVRGGKVVWE
jgi:hypothetical protein